MKKTYFKKSVSLIMTVLMLMSCWVFFPGEHNHASAADAVKDKYLFAYFTDNSSDGQTVHLAVSEDGLHYTALRNNEPVIIPSKGTGAIRDPYLWYNEQDNYYYLICTDMDASGNVWWDNCNGFLMWRSKDLVHWYDETFINVYDMLQKFNQPVEIVHRAWAPQIMWDGSSYVVYFSIDTDNVSYPADQLSIVYFKTSDLMNLDAYYEYGGLYYPGSDVNDAEIIQHPTTGKWYLFYKPEGDGSKIYMLQSDNATGPYTSPVADAKGLDIFSGVNEALEGGNGYFDNEGNFVMYADAYGHGSSYFYLTKTSATGDFMSWELIDNSTHNINSLSPRHGSVVKISTEEYKRLLNNAYGITSSSFSADEELSDHLIARYFTTADPTYNAANGKNDLTIYGTLGQGTDALATIGYYYLFDGSTYAQTNLGALDGGDFKDGFTITFTALATSGSNSRFYEIADNFGQQTDGVSHYTHFAVAGDNGGAYIGNYNGPSGVNHKWTAASKNYNDGQVHEYIVSYADGNTIVYCDGELIIKMNRFDNAGTDDEAWYDAIRNETMYIGKSGWSADPIFAGAIADFCIYDCSMSYYDVKNIQNEQDIEAGIVGGSVSAYNGFTNTAPSFKNDESDIGTSYYSNILYSPKVEGTLPYEEGEDKANPDSGSNSKQAAVAAQSQYTNVGIYYSKNTVMYVDGITTPKMPVMLAARLNKNSYDSKMIKAYPSASSSSTADSSNFYLTQNWYGWTRYPNFTYAISNPDGSSQRIGHNSSTSLSADLDDANTQGNRSVYYYASVLALNEANVTFNSYGYQKYDPSWYWEASTSGSSSSSGNASSNETSSQHGTNHAIWVVDLRSYVAAKNEIAANYNSIVTNTSYCPATVDAYKSVVEALMAFNASSYDYAGGVEAAVKACSTDAQKLVNEYNTAKANLGGCKTLTIEGREATCAYPGLTEGSYCEYCGEVFAEQTTTEKLAHTFGTQFTENGVDYYVQCSVCGLKLLVKQNEVRYENLFSLNSFFSTRSFNGGTVHNATASIDFEKSLLSIVNTAESGEGYTYGSHTNKNYANYSMPVEPSTTYVAEYYSTTAESIDVFVFYYDKDQNYINLASKGVSAIGTHTLEFTTPANCEYIEFRFDSNTAGKKVAVADFGLYTKDSYNTFAKENPYSRLGFNTGESIELYTPKRIGYEFLGWYTSSGTKITNTAQLENSVTVYAKWREVGNSVLYNGNLFSLTEYAKTNDYVMQNSVIDGHLWVDFANATFNTLSAREGLGKASLTEAQQLDTYNNYGSYRIPVTAGQEYVYTSTHANRSSYQTYLFFYGASGGVTHPATGSSHISHSTNNAANGAVSQWIGNTLVIRFTVPEGATHMSIRMGTTGKYAFTQTFSDIGLYTAEDYDEFVSGGFLPTQTYVPDGENVALATPERTGYTFAGWYENKDCTGNALTDTSAMTADKTVYAKWTPVEYTLTYALDGGSMSDATTKTYTIKDSFTLPTPTKTGYTFNGWKVTTADGNWAEDGVCNAGDTVANMSGNVTLTAQWTVNSFTVTFVDANGDTVEEKTYNYGEVPTAPANTAGYNDEEGHHTFAWPTISAVTGNVTYKETEKIGEHTVVTDAAVEPTCTSPGKTEGSHCSVCGEILVAQEDTPLADHTGEIIPAVDATCTALGKTEGKKCSVCGEILVAQEDVPMKDHSYGAWAQYNNGTTHRRTCENCPAYEEEGHNFTGEIRKIEGSNFHDYKCEKCDAYGVGTTHNLKEACYEAEATVTVIDGDEANHKVICKCSREKTEAHTWSGWVADPENKTDDQGKMSNTCEVCSYKKTTNCTYTVTTVDATCTDNGYKTYECKDCGNGYTEILPKLDHAPAEAVREKVVNATCYSEGSYDEVVYCSVCDTELSREPKTIERIDHTPAEAVRENEKAATCYAEGSYEEVIYCSVEACKHEISREPKTIEKIAHTPAEAVREKEVAATCYSEGSYDEVIYCSVEECKAKLSSTSKTIEKIAHTPAEAVREKEVAATCYSEGSYEEVVYCSVCKAAGKTEELSREPKTIERIAHTPAEAVRENEKAATCYAEGSYDEVVYCSVEECKAKLSSTSKTIEKIAHTPAEAVRENEKAATCYAEGSYDEVVYCSVCKAAGKTEELSRVTKKIAKIAHTPAEAVRENEKAATCYAEGSYDEVVYCSVEECKAKLSSTSKTIEKIAHTPAEAVRENEKAATCYAEGSYDEVVYCSVCKAAGKTEELSREPKTIERIDHTPAEAVRENEKAATCYAEGSYDEVVYCSVEECKAKLSSTSKTIEKIAHTPAEAVKENIVAATCYAEGSYDEVVYCSVCKAADKTEELSREPKTIERIAHTPAEAVRENEKAATCYAEGSYDEVVYCSVCKAADKTEELSREPKTIEKIAHTPAEAVRENEKAATCYVEGSYEEVIYCSVEACKHELSREPKTIEKIAHTPAEKVIENNIAPDCENEGSYDEVVYCSVCKAAGKTEELSRVKVTVEKTGHNYTSEVTKEPDCIEKGERTYTCQNDKTHTYTEEIAPLGHIDEDNNGRCDRCATLICDHKDQGTVITDKVDAKCEADGYTGDERCAKCNEIVKLGSKIDRTGHNYELTDSKDATCTEDGYETYTCKNDSSHAYTNVLSKSGHTASEAVIENKVAASCYAEGSYDEVVYCSVCDAELSSTPKTIAKIDHTPAEAVRENEKAATCYAEGSYDEVVYCSVEECKAKLSSTSKTIERIAHTPAEAVRENEVAATCYAEGSYDEVVYCSVCAAAGKTEVISRETKTIGMVAHTPAEAVRENETPATCYSEGSYDEVVYCSVEACKHEISRIPKTIAKIDHTPAGAVRENEVAATCYAEGSYDEVVYCSVEECKHKISSTPKIIAKIDHTPAEAVIENNVAPDCENDGSYDSVVYCSVEKCHYEISRNNETVGKLGHNYISVETKAPSCTEKGVMTFTCQNDESHTYTEDIEPLGHIDADSNGYCDRCTVLICDHKDQGTYVTDEVDATCEADGYSGDTRCNKCNEIILMGSKTDKLGHDYELTDSKDSTCTVDGYETYTCKNDRNHAYTDILKAPGHTPAEAVIENTVDASCYAEGSYDEVVYCSVCKTDDKPTELSRETKTIEKIAHTPAGAVRENEVAATCYAEGSYDEVVYCSVCEAAGKTEVISRETKTIGMVAHTAGEAVRENETPATCYSEGSYDEVVYCSVCDAAGKTEVISRETKTIGMVAHTPAEAVRENETPATCTVDGSYDLVVYCSVENCKAFISKDTITVSASGHTEETIPAVEATCKTTGLTEGKKCTVCGEITVAQTETALAPHTEETLPAVEATCNATGLTEGKKCTVCGEITVAQTVVPMVGHSWTAADCDSPRTCSVCGETDGAALGHTWTAATCTTPKTCSVCGKTEGTVGGHTVVTLPSKAPTCEEGGFSEGSYCSVCDEVFAAQIKFPATGHIEATRKENIVPSTCSQEGSYDLVTYCATCGKVLVTEAMVIDKLDHTPASEEILEEVLPTCKADGYRIGLTKCSVCGEEIERRVITLPALKHSVVETKAVEPTCETTGLTEGTHCEICGTVITAQKVIPAKGHKKETITATIEAATCTKEGVSEITVFCTVCDKTLSVERKPIPVAAHTPGDEIRENETPATCGKNGKYTSVVNCAVCGQEISNRVVVIPSTGEHDFTIEKNRVEPTCSENGYITYACEGCGTQEKTTLYAVGHNDKNGDSVCDDCGQSFDNNCGCLCHNNNWFIKFIYKIVRFFWKIFKVHKECYCTSVHY